MLFTHAFNILSYLHFEIVWLIQQKMWKKKPRRNDGKEKKISSIFFVLCFILHLCKTNVCCFNLKLRTYDLKKEKMKEEKKVISARKSAALCRS